MWSLVPVGSAALRAIPLAAPGTHVLGRGSGGVVDLRVSRRHVSLTAAADESWGVECLSSNPVELTLGSDPPLRLERGAAGRSMRAGDTLSLLPNAAQLRFRLDRGSGGGAPASDCSSPKRARLAMTAAADPPAAAGSDPPALPDPFPTYVQPPKPSAPEGLGALERLALSPES